MVSPRQAETICFKNNFFHMIEDCYFKVLEDTNAPALIMALEEGQISLNLSGIKRELTLNDNDPDSIMLDTIAEGLKYVIGLKIGDPVPSEILSGRASWEITDQHREIAANRVTMQLVSWLSGDEMLITEPEQLSQIANDPKTREKVSGAFSEAARVMGIDEENKGDVVSLVGNLAEELSYIEALRMSLHQIESIYENILQLEKKYKSERSVMEIICSIKRLFKIALTGFQNTFDQVDAQTGEILSALKNIGQSTKFIRDNRDDLHRRIWAWKTIIQEWQTLDPRRSKKSEELLNELYPFLAQRFLPTQEWELFSQCQEKTKKLTTEKLW